MIRIICVSHDGRSYELFETPAHDKLQTILANTHS